MEIVQDKILRLVHGRNPAWDYLAERWSALNGVVDLAMWPEWLVLGILFELKSFLNG